ncbi:DUF1868 domain-containing protein [Oryzibacter oryziterrae]|uniref:DUF1868 domain-containing protein n=1 Tax=Oryzibacter oryziterrae TaxID=2766474 RepID=UPI001F37DBB7|nr:DUF1868 domain-containing protein [Oryzibacter oryziterrae]
MSFEASLPQGTAVKFFADGRPRPYAGNTFVAALASERPESAVVADIAERLRTSTIGHRLTLLPRSSYHMTVFEGVCDAYRVAERWPADLPLDAPLAEAHAYFEDRIADVAGIAAPLRMKVNGLTSWANGLVIGLEAEDQDEDGHLRALRDRLSTATGLRKPDHATYAFHMTLGYWLDRPEDELWLVEKQGIEQLLLRLLPRLELPAPDFCHFADMHAFHPRVSLAR